MTPVVVGADRDEVLRRMREIEGDVDRIMLRHLAHQDLDTIAVLGSRVAPMLA